MNTVMITRYSITIISYTNKYNVTELSLLSYALWHPNVFVQ